MYPPGALPYVAKTDIHNVFEYVSSSLGLHQVALDEAIDEERWLSTHGGKVPVPWTHQRHAKATATEVFMNATSHGSGSSSSSADPPPLSPMA